MPVLSHLHHLFNAEQCQAYILHCGGKIVPSSALGVRARRLDAGVRTTTAPGANAPGAIAASAPSTISPIPCCTRAKSLPVPVGMAFRGRRG
jgi:hypothetical protein